jgi:hypothetical protein
MLERRRQSKTYNIVPGDELDDQDVELGEGIGAGSQETGVIETSALTVTEELDNWDENAEEWDEDETTVVESADGTTQKSTANSSGDDKC